MTKKDFKLIAEAIMLGPNVNRQQQLATLEYMADRLNSTYLKFNKRKFINYGLKLMETKNEPT